MDKEDSADVNDELPIEISEDELKRLAEAPLLSDFKRQQLDKDSKKNWNLFYKRNGDRFFKDRFWTRNEFNELFEPSDTRGGGKILLEVGCGCGNFVLPLLNHEPDLNIHDRRPLPGESLIYCCDISDRAISLLKENPIYRQNNPHRVRAFVADITQDVESIEAALDGNLVDIVSLIFVLSAIDPLKLASAARNIRSIMKPGGLVLFRDYAIYDQAMRRFGEKSKICDQFYVRQDGTRALFFTRNQLAKLFGACGFECKSIEYIQRETVNKASGDKFTRIFLQAKFTKTASPGPSVDT